MRQKVAGLFKTNKAFGYFSIGKSSFYLLLSRLIIVGVYFLADIYFARTLLKQEFGTWKQFLLLIQFFVPLLFLGIPEGFRYYSARQKSRWHIHFLNSFFLASVITGVLIIFSSGGFLGEVLSGVLNNPLLKGVGIVLPLLFLAMFMANIQKYVFLLLEKTGYLIAGSVLTGIVLIAGFYAVVNLDIEKPLIILVFLVYIAGLIASFILLSSVINIYKNIPFYKLAYFKESFGYLKYGFPLFLATIAGAVAQYTDKVVVSKLGGVGVFAVYSVGAVEVPVIAMIAASVSSVIYPKIVRLIKEKRDREAEQLWYNFTLRMSRLTYPVIIFMIVFADKIIKVVYTEKYLAAVPVFIIYLFLLFVRNNSYGLILLGRRKTNIYFVGQVVETILNIIFSILLFFWIGIIGPAISTVVCLFFLSSFYLFREGVLREFLVKFVRDIRKPVLLSLAGAVLVRWAVNLLL